MVNKKFCYCFFIISVLYIASSFIHGPIKQELLTGVPHWRIGPIAITRPLVLSGDAPHYLAAVNSIIEDRDLDLSNNYIQARQGDWDLGARFRNINIDRHVDRDTAGRELSTHSPFFPLLLATLTWPFQGTQWVEPVCVWTTMLVGLMGILYWGQQGGRDAKWLAALALATPLWCYSRDIWTEAWVATIWSLMLFSKNLLFLAVLGFLGTLIKYPFVMVPMTLGFVALKKKKRTYGWVLIGSGLTGIITAIALIQYIFRDVSHFSLFHSGVHSDFTWPFAGMVGLLAGPENGLFWFFPMLVWSLGNLRRVEMALPALAFFLLHAAYREWGGGTGFSARYLVPMLPVLVFAISRGRPSSWLFYVAFIYSLFWGFLGGFLPALTYDRTPWGVFAHVFSRIGASSK